MAAQGYYDAYGIWHEPGEQPGRAPAPAAPPGYTVPVFPPGPVDNLPTPPAGPTTSVTLPPVANDVPPPSTNTGLTSPSGPPSGGISDWGPQFVAPKFTAPAPFTYADFQKPADFTYQDFAPGTFTAPTLADAQNEPGYQFAVSEGQKALEGSKAAQGIYRTGGTLKDLYSWTNKFADQNYGNVFNRNLTTFNTNEGNRFTGWEANRNNAAANYATNLGSAQTAYGLNRGNAAANYATNYGVSRDVFDRNYQGALDEFAPRQDYARLDFARQWSDFLAKLDVQKTVLNAGAT